MKVTLLVSAAELDGGEIVLEGDRYRHLFRARRASGESEFRFTDGDGRERDGRLGDVKSRSARLHLEGAPRRLDAPPWMGLIVPVLKPKRTAWLIEKATELGVSEVRFYTGARAPRELTRAAHARLERVAAAALEQSHGAWLPRIVSPVPLKEAVAGLPREAARYVATQGAQRSSLCAAPCVWAVGAEGGWDPEEVELLADNEFTAVGLAGNVLRTETAALAGLSVTRACATGD